MPRTPDTKAVAEKVVAHFQAEAAPRPTQCLVRAPAPPPTCPRAPPFLYFSAFAAPPRAASPPMPRCPCVCVRVRCAGPCVSAAQVRARDCASPQGGGQPVGPGHPEAAGEAVTSKPGGGFRISLTSCNVPVPKGALGRWCGWAGPGIRSTAAFRLGGVSADRRRHELWSGCVVCAACAYAGHPPPDLGGCIISGRERVLQARVPCACGPYRATLPSRERPGHCRCVVSRSRSLRAWVCGPGFAGLGLRAWVCGRGG
jgi:hypothetical protein